MSGTAIPQSDAALLAAQAKAGQAGLDAYEAAKAEMASNRTNAISGALSAAESRGAPNAAMQSTLAGAEEVYDQRQASLTGAEAAYQDAMASRSQRAQDYQGAIQGARGLIADQAWQAVQPIKAQSEFQINQLRQSGENRVSEINANQALDMSRMTAEQAARQQQYDLDLARYQEEKRLELERYQEQMRLEAERFERQFQASYSRGSGGGGGGGGGGDDREAVTTAEDLRDLLQYEALNNVLKPAVNLASSSQQATIDAYKAAGIAQYGYTPTSMPNEPMLARNGVAPPSPNPISVISQPIPLGLESYTNGVYANPYNKGSTPPVIQSATPSRPGFIQSQTMNPQAPRPVVPSMPSFETPPLRPGFIQSQTMNPQAPRPVPSIPTRSSEPATPSFRQNTPSQADSFEAAQRQYLKDADTYGKQDEQYVQQRQDWMRNDFDTRIGNSQYADALGYLPEFNFDDSFAAEDSYLYDEEALQRAYAISAGNLSENFDFKTSSLINAMSDGNYENPNDLISRSEGRGDTASQTEAYEKAVGEQRTFSEKARAENTRLREKAEADFKADQKVIDDLKKTTDDEKEKRDIEESDLGFRQLTGTTPSAIFGQGTDPRDALGFYEQYEAQIENAIGLVNSKQVAFDANKWLEGNDSVRFDIRNELAPMFEFDLQRIDYQNAMKIVLARLVGYAE
jgi:hypothetical protein